jgi:electron transfer flavoprotein beta subunit
MNIVACMTRVPDTATRIRIAPSGAAIDPEGVQYVISPYDEFAVEEAIRLKEKRGGRVTIVTVGQADAQKDLRACLAKGCDEAVLMTHTGPLDSLQVATLLAAEFGPSKPDAIFCGKQGVEDDAAAVGPMLAALLRIPCVSRVSRLEVAESSFVATREIEGGLEETEGAFPCVITAEKGLNEPRRAGLKEIMGAKNKPLRTVALNPGAAGIETVRLEPPPERPAGRVVGQGAAAVPALIEALRKEARVL